MIWTLILPACVFHLKKLKYKSISFWCAVIYVVFSVLAVYDYFIYSGASRRLELIVHQYRILSAVYIASAGVLFYDFIKIVWRKYKLGERT